MGQLCPNRVGGDFDMAFPKKFAFFRHYPETLETDLSIIFKNLIVAGEKVQNFNSNFLLT